MLVFDVASAGLRSSLDGALLEQLASCCVTSSAAGCALAEHSILFTTASQ